MSFIMIIVHIQAHIRIGSCPHVSSYCVPDTRISPRINVKQDSREGDKSKDYTNAYLETETWHTADV